MKHAPGLNWNILKQRFEENFKKNTFKSYLEFIKSTGNSISNLTLKR